MMTDGFVIRAGYVYWVKLDGARMALRAIDLVPGLNGWWRCVAPLGSQVILPETAFLAESTKIWNGWRLEPE